MILSGRNLRSAISSLRRTVNRRLADKELKWALENLRNSKYVKNNRISIPRDATDDELRELYEMVKEARNVNKKSLNKTISNIRKELYEKRGTKASKDKISQALYNLAETSPLRYEEAVNEIMKKGYTRGKTGYGLTDYALKVLDEELGTMISQSDIPDSSIGIGFGGGYDDF